MNTNFEGTWGVLLVLFETSQQVEFLGTDL